MANDRPVTITDAETAEGLDLDWGRIRWLCNDDIDPKAEMTFGLVYIDAGKANPLHVHPNCEEIIFIMSGQCDHRLDDAWHPLEAGQMLVIPTGVKHCARNTGWEPARMVIAYSSSDRQTIFLEDE